MGMIKSSLLRWTVIRKKNDGAEDLRESSLLLLTSELPVKERHKDSRRAYLAIACEDKAKVTLLINH